MIARLFLRLARGSGRRRRWLFRTFFEFIARRSRDNVRWTQMNYGYADTAGSGHTIDLATADEFERFCHQLYASVACPLDLSSCDVLEVSSGRGGGSAFIARTMKPRSMTGVDIAHSAVAFCQRLHKARNLRFLQGDAESLPLPDDSFDAVINIEASFSYGDFDLFLKEVVRVLRPGGHLLFADLRFDHEIAALLASFRSSGLDCLETEDITDNVLRALELDAERREILVHRCAPWYASAAMRTFGGTRGSRIPRMLADGQMKYLRCVLHNPLGATLGNRTIPDVTIAKTEIDAQMSVLSRVGGPSNTRDSIG